MFASDDADVTAGTAETRLSSLTLPARDPRVGGGPARAGVGRAAAGRDITGNWLHSDMAGCDQRFDINTH